jgi:hypothetical protein
MRRSLLLSLSLLWCAGCSDPSDPADSGVDAGMPDPADAGADAGPRDAGPELDAGAADAAVASVNWITETEPQTIDGDIGLDFAFQYDVVVDDPFAYTLSIETCIQMAGMAEDCWTDPLGMAGTGTRYLRTGIDPTTYAVGENRYRWRVILESDVVVDDDVLELVLTVTSCETCVGGPGSP